jgi:hypothetical protein
VREIIKKKMWEENFVRDSGRKKKTDVGENVKK